MDSLNKKECGYCGQFFSPSYINKHVRGFHKKFSNGSDINQTLFSCDLFGCNKQYKYKFSLLRHIDVVHSKKRFLCHLCDFKATDKYYLKVHIKMHSSVSSSALSKNFKCAYCSKKFSSKCTLRQHEKIKHQILRYVRTKFNKKCPLCPYSSSATNNKEINDHFTKRHNLNMTRKKINFKNMEEFYKWKNTLEAETNSSFVQKRYSKLLLHYLCHRRGNYRSKGTNKRHLKITGSCKINAHCPCEIIAKIDKQSTAVSVSYLSTHVGHKNDLKFLHLRQEDKQTLALQLLSKTPHDEILKRVRCSISNNELKRIHLLNKKDLLNIETSYNVSEESRKHPHDPISVEAWVEELRTSIDTSLLLFKGQGKYDSSFPNLRKEDFVLIFMTEAQKEFLTRFGKQVICIDGTHGLNNYNFQLYTLLTIDESREGFPCAFMFTNRGDMATVSLFFQSIRNVAGQIKPAAFMSDMEETFYSAWLSVMGPPQMRLFCTWHVLKAWRSNLNKIKSKEKKEEVYKILKTLIYELDTHTFHRLVSAALKKFESDVETQPFFKYFQQYYIKGEIFKNWAYCYRTHAKINTNMSLENFNRVLKYCYLKGKKIKRLDKTLCAILNMIRDKLFDYVIKIKKGKLVSKLQLLRRRHKLAFATISKDHVLSTGDGKWSVMSSTGQELYCVIKVQECRKCMLQCLHCKTCFHEFMCTCMDNAIKNNMCKHIHAVARFSVPNTVTTVPQPDDDLEDHHLQVVEDDDSVEESILRQLNKKNTPEGKEVEKQKIMEMFQMMLEEANTGEQLEFIKTNIKSICQAVKALASTSERQFPVSEFYLVLIFLI